MGKALQRLFLAPPAKAGAHLLPLDGLRGFAVLIVIGSHLSNTGWLPWPNLSGIGKSGVYLFFVLSAYLLSGAMLAQPLERLAQLPYWLNYALRRVLRIWPLYLAILLLSAWLTRLGVSAWHYQMDMTALLEHLALRAGQSVLWSIPVEFTFYLWLPFIVLPLQLVRQAPGGRWLGTVLLVLLVLLARWYWPAAEAVTNGVGLGQYLVVFLCGVGAAWVHSCWPGLATAGRAWQALVWLLLALLLLATPSVWSVLSGTRFQSELGHRWFTGFGVGWALLLLGLLWGGGLPARLFASAPMRLVGVVSFSAYLWHMPVLQIAAAAGVRQWGWAGLGLVLASMLAVSMLSYLLFERPWRDVRYRKR